MKNTISILVLMLSMGWAIQGQTLLKNKDTKIYAVKFHADWCGACKAMSPNVKALPEKFDGQPVGFYSFDFTDDNTKADAAKLAKSLDIESIYAANQVTGFMLVIDADSKKILETLTMKDDLDGILAKLKAVLES
jgi:thiol-disulfide isomerase/thioredoxin